MKQTDNAKIKLAYDKLSKLKTIRGGSILASHRRFANDPRLLQAFIDQYNSCNVDASVVPEKYRELIFMAIGAAKNEPTTTKVHAKKACDLGATIDELGEVLRIVFFTCGVTSLIQASEIFEELME